MARQPTLSLGEVLGEISDEDLLAPVAPPPPAPTIAKVRQAHHNLAKLLASGMGEGEAGVICGYSQSRVSILKADPAFQELLSFYSSKSHELFSDVMGMVRDLAVDSLMEIRDRLESNPERVSTKDLLVLVNTSLDRLGYAPVQRHVHIHADSTVEALRAAAARARASQVVYVDQDPSREWDTESHAEQEPMAEEPAEGLEGQRLDVSEEGHRVDQEESGEEPGESNLVQLDLVPVRR